MLSKYYRNGLAIYLKHKLNVNEHQKKKKQLKQQQNNVQLQI